MRTSKRVNRGGNILKQEYTYRCPVDCPIHKRCFVIKLKHPLKEPLHVLQKCLAKKGADIEISIYPERPP